MVPFLLEGDSGLQSKWNTVPLSSQGDWGAVPEELWESALHVGPWNSGQSEHYELDLVAKYADVISK